MKLDSTFKIIAQKMVEADKPLEQRIIEAVAMAAGGQNNAFQITVHVERVPRTSMV